MMASSVATAKSSGIKMSADLNLQKCNPLRFASLLGSARSEYGTTRQRRHSPCIYSSKKKETHIAQIE